MHLTLSNPATKTQSFYRLEIVKGLFGDWGLMREWGRVGKSGRLRTDWFDTELDAKDARFAIHMKKAIQGYD